MSKKRFRLRFTFWLDVLKAKEHEIAERIEVLKEERQFSRAIRVGILIFDDLRQGNVDYLLEYFPWVKDKIIAEHGSEISIQTQISRLEDLIQQQNLFSKTQSDARSYNTFDDGIQLEEKVETVDSSTITKNLNESLLSMF